MMDVLRIRLTVENSFMNVFNKTSEQTNNTKTRGCINDEWIAFLKSIFITSSVVYNDVL